MLLLGGRRGGVIIRRGCVTHYVRLTQNKRNGATPGPVINTIVIRGKGVVKRKFRHGYNRTRTRIGTITSIQSRTLLQSSAVCMDLRPYSRCKGAPPYTRLVVEGNVPHIIINALSPFPRISKQKMHVLHRTNVRIIANILRRRTHTLGPTFVAFRVQGHPCICLG